MADGTTRGKRRLARFIKQLQEKSGLTAEEIARRTRVSRPTVTRLLAGTHLARWPSVSVILDELGAAPEQKTFLLQMWEVADVDNATIEHAAALPVKYRRFRMDELEAHRERTLDVVYVPGMLQTAAYAEAVARASHRLVIGDSWDRTAAAERLTRQQLLDREEPFRAAHPDRRGRAAAGGRRPRGHARAARPPGRVGPAAERDRPGPALRRRRVRAPADGAAVAAGLPGAGRSLRGLYRRNLGSCDAGGAGGGGAVGRHLARRGGFRADSSGIP
ncbi:helix-turn-helix domain-containing protein [Saccharothrix algeriensis]|uniref:Helix-turn-helix domain-containing protein n=1 Tax=Saccharothrix algeriensis TaxID=173560 RepID=A0A8T8I4S0_9PSEU|nr:helix-turn-helix domain-containing protein [Saccharothrix algeriensis]